MNKFKKIMKVLWERIFIIIALVCLGMLVYDIHCTGDALMIVEDILLFGMCLLLDATLNVKRDIRNAHDNIVKKLDNLN